MATVRNLLSILLNYLPTASIIAIIIAVILIKKKINKLICGAAVLVAAFFLLSYVGGPFTAGPHTAFAWKNIISTETLSKEEVYGAMEVCKEFFREEEANRYCRLRELRYEENNYYRENNYERIIIEPVIETGFLYDSLTNYDRSTNTFVLERADSGEWKVIISNDND